MIQFHHLNNLTNYIVSLMEVSVNQQKSSCSIPIVKNFSVILKSLLRNNKNSISLAITKLEVLIGIYVLDYVYRMAKVLHSAFLRNQWVLKFISDFSK